MRYFITAAALLAGCVAHRPPLLDPLATEPAVDRAPPTAPSDAARDRLPTDLDDEATALSPRRVADRVAGTPTRRQPQPAGGHAPTN